ncbi:helix-turn-helix domain-containing protein [Streptomyces hoynatensis]|uniref:XRE family transcriptional regulator n=1 Tax=Streptomyces hoynatensis TaxID=1141874 RepID=A0A3A9ZHX1_9ACTN|nr:helix-turn-helix transcriptional regulator [Streptomyces hoynatensis]RKN46866.1 XRE family transcriptional regulator [Streptomyces hoynatensis]
MGERIAGDEVSDLAAFGIEVLAARESRKIKQRHLADATGYSRFYVSKVEHGVQMPSDRFAERCDEVFGTNGLFRRLRRRISNLDPPAWFAPYLRLEPQAARIFDWSVHCLVGFAQTDAYARAIFRAGYPRDTAESIALKAAERLRRREKLDRADPPPEIWLVVYEAALRAVVGGPRVMADQLASLARYAESPGVDFQVMPFGAGAHGVHMSAFTLLTFSDETATSVWADGPRGGRLYQEAAVTAEAARVHERMRAHALSPRDSLNLLCAIREEHLKNV